MTTTRSPFLSQSYGAYDHRDVPSEDAPLTHTGPGTPCGEYMRRFWQPVIFSDDLKDLPIPLKILGEELVAFRDKSGNVGLMELHCPHRGTSLEFGILCDHGIRCCYHGWQMDVDGKILDTPGEPPDSTLKDRLYQGAYPVHEYNGVVFAYMGPPDLMPPFPMFDSYSRPGFRMIPGRKYFYPCNWLQILENAMDPTHTAFLHTIVAGSQFTDEFGVLPELGLCRDPGGNGIHRRPPRRRQRLGAHGRDGAAQPPAGGPHLGDRPAFPRLRRPDDEPLDRAHRRHQHHVHRVSSHRGVRGRCASNTPVVGRPQRDAASPATRRGTRPITTASAAPAITTPKSPSAPSPSTALEHLGVTDRGIIMFRRRLRKGIEATAQGQDPEGISREDGLITTYCNDSVIPAPAAPTSQAETHLLQETARNLVREYLARG